MSTTRLAHVVAEFDYPIPSDGRDEPGLVQAVKQIVVAGLWRSALSSFPDVTVTLQPMPEEAER